MQKVSNEYVESMKSIGRNRGYIRVTLGIVNSEAQENLETASDSSVAYFSSDSILHGQTVTQVYATCEQNFSKVNGNMYFLPTQGSSATIYPNGIVSNSLLGGIKFDFGNGESYDLVGFTIDFGENYPIDFTISGGGDSIPFTGNDSRYFTTELGLHGVDSFTITPTLMLGGDTRLRIYSISLGVSNVFTNENTLSYRETTYVSPLADSLPSTDISVTVENYDQYYNPDNPNSVLAFFEVGQEVKVQFGYDTLDDGVIEWLPETVTHLKTWQATDRDATFTATDVFDYVSGTYYGGKYYPQGISLYDLAEDIFADAGVERYRIDTSLEDVIVYNPMPAVDYTQALQIIANAGRCSLRESRDGMIYIESEYIPDIKDFTLTCNGQTDYSNVANLVSEDAKTSYAIYSKDFTKLNDSKMLFKGSQVDLTKVGYTSSAVCNSNGVFTTNPVITMTIGTDYSAPSMNIKFRNVAPQEFVIRTYFNNIGVETITVSDPDILFTTETGFAEFDTMEIEFTKGAPNSRITIDQIWFGSPTDYTLYRNMFYDSPTATRQERIKSISVSMFNYKDSAESIKDLVTSEIKNAESTEYTFTFNNPSYGFTASVTEGTASISIIKSSAYAITIALSNVLSTDVKIAIQGYEYSVDEQRYTATHSNTGVEKAWSNPLISDAEHAKMIEKWLSDYFLGDVEYEFNWRGDPRIDADDLLKLELKTGEIVPVKNYQNTLEFNGAWSGSMKARKVVAPTVEKSEVTPPTVTSSLTYNGSVQTATVSSYNPSLVEVTGITGTDAGTYTATLRLLNKNDYMWSDGTTANKQSSWTIAKANGNVTLSSTSVTLDNDHLTQTVTASNATGALSVSSSATSIATASISGNTITISNVNKTDGTATVTVSVASSANYNATTKTINVACNYSAIYVTPPTVTSNLTYNGSQQTATVSTYDPSVISVTGITGTNAGSYTATLSLLDKTNYRWSDNTTADKTTIWSIAKATGSITLSKNEVELNDTKLSDTVTISSVTGSVSNVTVSSSDTSVATASRNNSTIIVSSVNNTDGNAIITATLAQTTNYTSATATISVTCEFAIQEVTPPTITANLTYNGNQQTATVSSYDPNIVSVTGITGTDAGAYIATISLLDTVHYMWTDKTIADKTVEWSIARATGYIHLAKDSVLLNNIYQTTDDISISVPSTLYSSLIVTSSDSNVVTGEIVNQNLHITAIANTGNATITVTLPQTTNYTSASATVGATIYKIPTWANGTDAEILQALEWHQLGYINLYNAWNVGDTRRIVMNAITDTPAQSQTNTEWVIMNKSGIGGTGTFVVGMNKCLDVPAEMYSEASLYQSSWNTSKIRTWCNGAFKDALQVTSGLFKQFENINAGGTASSAITRSDDYFAPPAEKQVFGSAINSNSIEASYLTQFNYFRTASKRVYKRYGQNVAVPYWLRSPSSTRYYWCNVNTSGESTTSYMASDENYITLFGVI